MEEIFHLGIKALFVNDENKVLVLKANPDDFKAETPVHWDLPGGRVEKGHSIEKTLAKEIEEELGIPGSEIIVERDFHLDISSMRIPVDNGDVGLVLLVKQCRLPGKEPSPLTLSTQSTNGLASKRQKNC